MNNSFFGKKGYTPVPEEGSLELSQHGAYELQPIPTDSGSSEHSSSETYTHSEVLGNSPSKFQRITKYILYTFVILGVLAGCVHYYTNSSAALPILNNTNPITDVLGDEDQGEGASHAFDHLGRFIMKNYDLKKPMANFLAGIGGLWGVPMWVFSVNRGQVITSFGLKNKDGGISLFETAEKAYQNTPLLGFRTFVKGSRMIQQESHRGNSESTTRTCWQYQPFFPDADSGVVVQSETISVNAKDGADRIKASVVNTDLGDSPIPPKRTRDMHTGKNEIEIIEHEPTLGLKTNVLYHTTTDEDFPALIRRVTFTNTGDGLLDLEALGVCTTCSRVSYVVHMKCLASMCTIYQSLLRTDPPPTTHTHTHISIRIHIYIHIHIHITLPDGLAKLYPSGLTYGALNTMGRTLEAWMRVYNAGDGNSAIKQPFFHITQGFADTTTISIIKAGVYVYIYI